MNEAKKYWFPAKHHGWGWSFPVTWQGKAVILSFFVLVTVGAFALLPKYGDLTFIIYCCVLSLVLIAICWVKGEPAKWRCGNK